MTQGMAHTRYSAAGDAGSVGENDKFRFRRSLNCGNRPKRLNTEHTNDTYTFQQQGFPSLEELRRHCTVYVGNEGHCSSRGFILQRNFYNLSSPWRPAEAAEQTHASMLEEQGRRIAREDQD